VPTVGAKLVCSQGSWSGTTPQSYAYQWLRDGRKIAGATAAAYTITATDAGRTLACQVTARNIAGSASRTTAALRIPVPRGRASVGRARVNGTIASVFVKCKGIGPQLCTVTLKMTVRETLTGSKVIVLSAVTQRERNSKRTVVVGATTVTLRAGKSLAVRVRLNGTGRRLLTDRGKLTVRLATTQITLSGTAAVASQALTFKASRKRYSYDALTRARPSGALRAEALVSRSLPAWLSLVAIAQSSPDLIIEN
jgi:hypothetical protein